MPSVSPVAHDRDHQQRAEPEREQQLDLLRVGLGVADQDLGGLLLAKHPAGQRVLGDREALLARPAALGQRLDDLLVGQPARQADRVGLELLADQGQRALEVLAGAGAREPGAQVLEATVAGGDPAAPDRAGAQRLGERGPADLGRDRRDQRPRRRRAGASAYPWPHWTSRSPSTARSSRLSIPSAQTVAPVRRANRTNDSTSTIRAGSA